MLKKRPQLDSEGETEKREECKAVELDQETMAQIRHIVDVQKLIEVYLLGKAKRYLRITAALLLKSLYESKVIPFKQIMKACHEKFRTLGASGVNSSEFLSLFGYLCD